MAFDEVIAQAGVDAPALRSLRELLPPRATESFGSWVWRAEDRGLLTAAEARGLCYLSRFQDLARLRRARDAA